MKSYLLLIGGCHKIMAGIQTHQYSGNVCSRDNLTCLSKSSFICSDLLKALLILYLDCSYINLPLVFFTLGLIYL